MSEGAKRGASFSEVEQVNLTHAWIEISMDPIHGNDQKGPDFYKKISELFKEKMGTYYVARSPESLHAHWRDNIQYNVAKFTSAYTKATSRAISGYTPDDYIREAQALFMADSKSKKPFKAMKYWEILKNHTKWSPTRSESFDDGAIGPTVERPIGCHTAKKAKIDSKSMVKSENSKGEQIKTLLDAIGASNRERKELASKSFGIIEKSNALKELKFFESDTSENGKLIAKQLRDNYVQKYVLNQTETPITIHVPVVHVTTMEEDATPVDDITTAGTTTEEENDATTAEREETVINDATTAEGEETVINDALAYETPMQHTKKMSVSSDIDMTPSHLINYEV